MNKCTDVEIQEMLPDFLHRALADDATRRVEAHLASCESCREELEILRTVKSAAVFAPTIDVDRVVRQIPPYKAIIPGIEAPAWHRPVQWLVAAAAALIIIVGGSTLATRHNAKVERFVRTDTLGPLVVDNSNAAVPPKWARVDSQQPTHRGAPALAHAHALALAADVDGLSDRSLVQLMNEMDRFDALPSAEPDPVISVDSGDSL
jgi:hypothetical protein